MFGPSAHEMCAFSSATHPLHSRSAKFTMEQLYIASVYSIVED